MAGNENSGRTRVDDPKYKLSARIRISTQVKIDDISEKLGIEKSKVVQEILDAGIDSLSKILHYAQNSNKEM